MGILDCCGLWEVIWVCFFDVLHIVFDIFPRPLLLVTLWDKIRDNLFISMVLSYTHTSIFKPLFSPCHKFQHNFLPFFYFLFTSKHSTLIAHSKQENNKRTYSKWIQVGSSFHRIKYFFYLYILDFEFFSVESWK